MSSAGWHRHACPQRLQGGRMTKRPGAGPRLAEVRCQIPIVACTGLTGWRTESHPHLHFPAHIFHILRAGELGLGDLLHREVLAAPDVLHFIHGAECAAAHTPARASVSGASLNRWGKHKPSSHQCIREHGLWQLLRVPVQARQAGLPLSQDTSSFVQLPYPGTLPSCAGDIVKRHCSHIGSNQGTGSGLTSTGL